MDNYKNKYNTKIPAVKRLMKEACELREPTEEYSAKPLEDNLFEWHFTVKGAPSTEFENGYYHGRIILPNEYPMKPPNIILLTPNGRFEVNKKICLSISSHHPETWQPSWSIRTALLGLIAFMPTCGKGTIGSLDYSADERRILARKSIKWECPKCGLISQLLGSNAAPISSAECQLIKSVVFKADEAAQVAKETKNEESTKDDSQTTSAQVPNSFPEVISQPHNCIPPSHDIRFTIGETTSTFLITLIIATISFLIYRRLFLL